MIKRIIELLVVMSIVIGQIQFLLFSLAGIEYDPEEGSGLVAYLNLAFFAICIGWVFWQEIRSVAIRKSRWPYVLIVLIIFDFFLESTIFPYLTLQTFAGRQFLFFGTSAVPSIILATYIYRHNRFDIIARNMEIIMYICTLALILNLPQMMTSGITSQSIGGGGGHQDISYMAAFCFAIVLTNLISGNTQFRYRIFLTRTFKYFNFALLPIQAIICILGGGRGGGVLLVISFLSIIYLYSHQNFGKAIRWGILSVIAFVAIALSTGVFSEGLGRTFDYLQGGSLDLTANQSDIERALLRERSFEIISDSPILGHGLWNGLVVSGFYMHNVFLDVLISGGIVYLIVFLIVMKRVYKSTSLILIDKSKCMLLPFALYSTILLLFSGFYLKTSTFWFFSILALLYYKQYRFSKH